MARLRRRSRRRHPRPFNMRRRRHRPLFQSANPVTLFGYVFDTAFRAVSGVRVEVIDGPQAGTETTSDARGYFSIEDQFSGLVTARATKDGYAPSVVTSRATTDRRFYVLFQLASITAPVSLAGNYTLTISADSACTALPDDARTRSYLARVTAGSEFGRDSFSGTVTGGQFAGNRFWIGVFGDYVTISTAGEGPSLVEQPDRTGISRSTARPVCRSERRAPRRSRRPLKAVLNTAN